MYILVTGAQGRLGGVLVSLLAAHGHVVTGIDIAELDITDWGATARFVVDTRPDLVIHPASWTDVDGCARDPQHAIRVNGYGAQHMALAAAQIGVPILAISTNEVFDGTHARGYHEYDRPNPINPYAVSKWVGEQAVQRVNPRHYVVRTAWLFAHGGKNFIQSILGAAQGGKSLRVVTDEVANPTYTDDLAAAIVKLCESERFGVYHLVNSGACSRYEFARYVLDHTGFADTPITPITSDQWARASTPPPYTPLENIAGAMIGVTMRPWQDAVDAFLQREGLYRA
jgi:dTDP-4-dehydrorhamnose reductase